MAQGPCEKDGLYGYLIDGECIVGGKKRRRKGKGKGKGKVQYAIPSYSDFELHALSVKPSIDVIELRKKYDAWINNNWHDGYGNEIKNWKSKLNSTIPYIKEKQVTKVSNPPKMVF